MPSVHSLSLVSQVIFGEQFADLRGFSLPVACRTGKLERVKEPIHSVSTPWEFSPGGSEKGKEIHGRKSALQASV